MFDYLPWRKKKSAPEPLPFRSVLVSARISEYQGTLPRLHSFKIEHWLFCERITRKVREALLAEEFRGIGGEHPTHAIVCVVSLPKEKGTFRPLFTLYLDLSEEVPVGLQDWCAARITRSLARSLTDCKETAFLIRCKHDREYPWCLHGLDLDDYWLTECGKYYRFYLRRLSAIDPGEVPY